MKEHARPFGLKSDIDGEQRRGAADAALALGDGRGLASSERGDPQGRPPLTPKGAPGSRLDGVTSRSGVSAGCG
jgi:hypothetical protein